MKSDCAEFLIAHGRSVGYPRNATQGVFADRRSRPMALLIGSMAMYGSKEPWGVPQTIKDRLGIDTLHPDRILGKSEDLPKALEGIYHLPRDMSKWLRAACNIVVAEFCGQASWIWNNGFGIPAEKLFSRLISMPGIGTAKAMVLIGILNRDLEIAITDWDALRPSFTSAMERVSKRIGLPLLRIWEDPRKLPEIYEGLRMLAHSKCLDRPECENCPLALACPENGMGNGR